MQYTVDDFTKDFYTIGEVAHFFKVSPKTIQKWDNTGVLKFSQASTGREVLSKEDLIASLDAKGMYQAISKASLDSQSVLDLITSKDFSDGFFPVAVSNDTGGVPTMCPVTFESKYILGVDFSGEQQAYSEKHGAEIGEEVMCTPHLLVTGVTGGGKSVILQKLIIKGLVNPSWEVIGVDMADVAFARFKKYGMKTANTLDDTLNVFYDLHNEVLSRLETLEKEGDTHYKRLPSIMAVIDEIGFLDKHKSPVHEIAKRENLMIDKILEYITDISRLGHTVGIHLAIGTQRSDLSFFSEEVKANLSGIIATGKLTSKRSISAFGTDAGTKIGEAKGQMYISCHGRGNYGQGLFVSPNEIDEYLNNKLGNAKV